jgi:hypothetical protein
MTNIAKETTGQFPVLVGAAFESPTLLMLEDLASLDGGRGLLEKRDVKG